MADFSTNMTYPSNFIRPGKRPLSSMSPVVITDENGDVKMVVGAAGGSKITSTTAIVSIYEFWLLLKKEIAIIAFLSIQKLKRKTNV